MSDPIDELPSRRAHLRKIADRLNADQREYAPDDPSRQSIAQPGVIRILGGNGQGAMSLAKVR